MITKIGLCGATGKMGQTIIQRVTKFSDCEIAALFSSKDDVKQLKNICSTSKVVIDFSVPEILEALVNHAMEYGVPLVIGTTNLKPAHFNYIKEASRVIPILYSANMSLGANLLAILSKISAKILDDNYDIEILDTHHRDKKDAPSGTAILFAKIVAEARGLNFDQYVTFNRSNKPRIKNEIGVHSIRGGGVHGIHDVSFLSDTEIITLQHQALNRNHFADGAIKAALWLINNKKSPGMYSMVDVFNLDCL